MLKLKKVFAVLITLAVIASVVASMAYATSGDGLIRFRLIIGSSNSYSYTEPIEQDPDNPVKFFPMDSTSTDTFVYINVKFRATNGTSSTGGDNVTANENGVLVPYLPCQVGYVYKFELIKNNYKNVYLGIASDYNDPYGYEVNGIWGYGSV